MQTAIVMKKGNKFYVQISGEGCWVRGLHAFKTKKRAQAFCEEFTQLEQMRVATPSK